MDAYLLHQHSEMEKSHWWFIARRLLIADVLDRWLSKGPPTRQLLDLGCGAGTMIELLARFGQVTALDTSPDAVEFCRARYPGATFVVGRVPDALPPGATLDVVTAFDVIEHIPDDRSVLSAIHDALKPQGLFICTVPAYQWLWGPHDELNYHQRRYSRGRLARSLADAGFVVEWISYYNTLLFPIVAAVRLGNRLLRPNAPPSSDFDYRAGPLTGPLVRLFSFERHLLRRLRLPFGVSLVAVARRRADLGVERRYSPPGDDIVRP